MHTSHLVSWRVDLLCSAVSQHVCVCVSSRVFVPEAPRTQISQCGVCNNRQSTGTPVKVISEMDTHH